MTLAPLRVLRDADWLAPRRLRLLALLMIVASAVGYLGWLAGTTHGYDPDTLKPIPADFTSFWIAARFAASGHPALAYDLAAHTQAQLAALPFPPGAAVPIVTFSYPPSFLLLVTPFGLLPSLPAFVVWIGLTTALFVAMAGAIAPRGAGALPALLALGFSGTFVNLQYGQNGALTAALFGLGLLWLERRPWLAGACFALLTCKPQLGLLIPLALLAGRHHVAIAAAALCAGLLLAASWLAFGTDTWLAFLGTLGWSRTALLEHGETVWARMPTLFAAIRLLGLPLPLAYAAQAAASAVAAATVWRLWRRPAPPALRHAGLAVAATLATPYLLHYDLMLLGVALAWLGRDLAAGPARGPTPWLPAAMLATWFAPALSLLATPLGAPVIPALGFALLRLIARRADSPPLSLP